MKKLLIFFTLLSPISLKPSLSLWLKVFGHGCAIGALTVLPGAFLERAKKSYDNGEDLKSVFYGLTVYPTLKISYAHLKHLCIFHKSQSRHIGPFIFNGKLKNRKLALLASGFYVGVGTVFACREDSAKKTHSNNRCLPFA